MVAVQLVVGGAICRLHQLMMMACGHDPGGPFPHWTIRCRRSGRFLIVKKPDPERTEPLVRNVGSLTRLFDGAFFGRNFFVIADAKTVNNAVTSTIESLPDKLIAHMNCGSVDRMECIFIIIRVRCKTVPDWIRTNGPLVVLSERPPCRRRGDDKPPRSVSR
jgi:hypothetical protein